MTDGIGNALDSMIVETLETSSNVDYTGVYALKFRARVGHDADDTYDDYTTCDIIGASTTKGLNELPTAAISIADIDHAEYLASNINVDDEIIFEVSTDLGATYNESFRGIVKSKSANRTPDGTDILDLRCGGDRLLTSRYINYNQCVMENKKFSQLMVGKSSSSNGVSWPSDSKGNYPDGILYGTGYAYSGPDYVSIDGDEVGLDIISFKSAFDASSRYGEYYGLDFKVDDYTIEYMTKSYIEDYTTSDYTASFLKHINSYSLTSDGKYKSDGLVVRSKYPFIYRKGSGAEKDMTMYLLRNSAIDNIHTLGNHAESFYKYVQEDSIYGKIKVTGITEDVLGKKITINDENELFTASGNVVAVDNTYKQDRWVTTLKLGDKERDDVKNAMDLEKRVDELETEEIYGDYGDGLYYFDTFTTTSDVGYVVGLALGTSSESGNDAKGIQSIKSINRYYNHYEDDEFTYWKFVYLDSGDANYHIKELVLLGNDIGDTTQSTTTHTINRPHWGNDDDSATVLADATASDSEWAGLFNFNISSYSFEDSVRVNYSSSHHTLGNGMDGIFGAELIDTTDYGASESAKAPAVIMAPTADIWSTTESATPFSDAEYRYLAWDNNNKTDSNHYFTKVISAPGGDNEYMGGIMLKINAGSDNSMLARANNLRVYCVFNMRYDYHVWNDPITPTQSTDTPTGSGLVFMWRVDLGKWDTVRSINVQEYLKIGTVDNTDWHCLCMEAGDYNCQRYISPEGEIHALISTYGADARGAAAWGPDHDMTMSFAYAEAVIEYDANKAILEAATFRYDNPTQYVLAQTPKKILGLYTNSVGFYPEGENLLDKNWSINSGYGSQYHAHYLQRPGEGEQDVAVLARGGTGPKSWMLFIHDLKIHNPNFDGTLYFHYLPDNVPIDGDNNNSAFYVSHDEELTVDDEVYIYHELGDINKSNKLPYYSNLYWDYEHVGSTGDVMARVLDTVGIDKTPRKRVVVQFPKVSL